MFSSNATQVSSSEANYIEDVFSTYLYTGNGSTQTITNGIDLSTKGGLVWIKQRSAGDHVLMDTVRGANYYFSTNSVGASAFNTVPLTPFTSTGFDINVPYGNWNASATNYASWTFREQPKFFDIVTYTGTGSNRTIAHALGSVPGSIFVKRTDTTGAWQVYHRSLANTEYLVLNTTAAAATGATRWNSTTPTSTVFSLGTDATVNSSDVGATYVAYLFAHDAGGFGLSGTDNVISCGSFTTDGSGNASVTLGYEPQWIVIKKYSDTGDWDILDTMRGWVVGGVDSNLKPNTSAAESAGFDRLDPTATGFVSAAGVLSASQPYIYIAIRRGPMKVPTLGTSVFTPVARTPSASNFVYSTNPSVVDFVWQRQRAPTAGGPPQSTNQANVYDRLRGTLRQIATASNDAEASYDGISFASNTGYTVTYGSYTAINDPSYPEVYWNFSRAPSFADEVCFLGTGVAQNITHNLGAVPELIIVKNRTTSQFWAVYSATTGATVGLILNNTTGGFTDSAYWNNTAPTSSVFTVGTSARVNGSAANMVAYLFATCAGVSKVGSFTGNGTTQAIPCGFTGGARFVLIKRTGSAGSWYVYDTARGMTLLTDPYLLLNTTADESPTLGSVTTTTGGFTVDASILADINISLATYIFLAIA